MGRIAVAPLVLAAMSLGLACELSQPAAATQRPTSAAPSWAAAAQTPNVPRATFRGDVTARTGLSIRALPTANSTKLGGYSAGAGISILCEARGQDVDGDTTWYRLANRSGWVAARYVHATRPVSPCEKPGPTGHGPTGPTGPSNTANITAVYGAPSTLGPHWGQSRTRHRCAGRMGRC